MKKFFTLRYVAMTAGLASIVACTPFCDQSDSGPTGGQVLAQIPYTGVNQSAVDCHIYMDPGAMTSDNRVNAGQIRAGMLGNVLDFSGLSSRNASFVAVNPGGTLATGISHVAYSDLRAGRKLRVTYNGTPNLVITLE